MSKIPWPDEFHGIPDIARTHHEKLDPDLVGIFISSRAWKTAEVV